MMEDILLLILMLLLAAIAVLHYKIIINLHARIDNANDRINIAQ